MGKLLRVVVIILLILSIGALVFGIMLFLKRELLKGRTQKLETTLFQLGPVIEAGPATEIPAKSFDSRDIAPCTAEVLDSPQKSPFWDTYRIELELPDQPRLDVKAKERELKTYYKIDPVTGKIERDPMTRLKVTSGEGTMQSVLNEVLKAAVEQYNRLNDTRAQLKALREEYIATVQDLNAQKKVLREKLVYIVQLETKIKELEEKIRQLEQKIADLEAEIKKLQETIAEKEKEIQKLNEVIANKNTEIVRLKNEIEQLRGQLSGKDVVFQGKIEPGKKGTVVAADPQWNFVVVDVSEAFMKEVLGNDLSFPVPIGVELNIRRAGEGGKFVTKIRLMNVRTKQHLAVGDVLMNWKQKEVNVGDIVFF